MIHFDQFFFSTAVFALTRVFNCATELDNENANKNTREVAHLVNGALQALCKDSPMIQESL